MEQRGDFREHFDIRKLSEEDRGMIEFVLNSPAYGKFFKPYFQDILDTLNQQWKDRSRERQDRYPDEFLAGGVVFGEAMLKFFEIVIQETTMERIHGAMENLSNDQVYELRRTRGLMKPVVGVNQSAEPQQVAPEDDF